MMAALELFKQQRPQPAETKPALPASHHDAIIADIPIDIYGMAVTLFDENINRLVFARYLWQRGSITDEVR